MKRARLFILTGISLLGLVVISMIFPQVTKAQSSTKSTDANSAQALEIGPTVLSFSADPGETATAKIMLRDVSSSSLIVTNEINDFTANGEDGTPKIILEDDDDNPYSIKKWIDPIPKQTLKSKEIKEIVVNIKVPANASPGGYYGVIRFTGTAPELEDTGVSLSASLGTLVLLTVNGDAKESLEVEEFSVNYKGKTGTLFETGPLNFVSRLKNTGNIHEEPFIWVTIKDMFGNKVANIPLNSPPAKVLPDSIRRFEQELSNSTIGNKILFGQYTAEMTVTYGKNKQTLAKTISFWVIPYTLIGFIILGLIGGFIILRFLIKRYNDHILSTSSRRSRRR